MYHLTYPESFCFVFRIKPILFYFRVTNIIFMFKNRYELNVSNFNDTTL
jgi:hypothetical protein